MSSVSQRKRWIVTMLLLGLVLTVLGLIRLDAASFTSKQVTSLIGLVPGLVMLGIGIGIASSE